MKPEKITPKNMVNDLPFVAKRFRGELVLAFACGLVCGILLSLIM